MEFRGKSIFFLLVISTLYTQVFTQESHAEIQNNLSFKKTILFDVHPLEMMTEQYYKSLESQITDIYSFVEKISNDSKRVDKLRHYLRYSVDGNTTLVGEFQSMGINITALEAFAKNNLIRAFKTLDSIQNGLYILANWYQLLTTMRSKLTEYSSQQNKDILKGSELYRKCRKNSPITQESLRQFSSLIDSVNMDLQDTLQDKYKAVEFVEIDAPKRDALCKMLDLSLNSIVTTSCLDGGRMQVRGDIVKLSDINSFCLGDLKVLEIFALTTVYLDRDLKGRDFDVVVVAPTWKVVGKQSCYAAMSFYDWASEFKDWLCTPNEKNKDALFWFLRCENPMLKDYSPNLYAQYCSKKVDDNDKLPVLMTIFNLNGGIQPPSESGQYRAVYVPKNSNGRLAFLYKFILNKCSPEISALCNLTSRASSTEDPLQEITNNYTIASHIRRVIDLSAEGVEPYPTIKFSRKWLMTGHSGASGEPGEPGKPGGNFLGIGQEFSGMRELMVITNGGRGGTGEMGHYGTVHDDGQNGRGGDGGRGGIGGTAGEAILIQVKKYPEDISPVVFNVRSSNGTNGMDGFGGWPGGSSLDTPFQEGGLFGVTGGNAKDIKLPEKAVLHWRVPSIAKEYKKYLLDHLDDMWRKSALTNMYADLDNS